MFSKRVPITRLDDSKITFYLEQRAEKPSSSLLILLQGSDCNSVANIFSLNTELPQILPSADLLTVEKYGLTSDLPYSIDNIRPEGCPAEYIKNNSPHQRVNNPIQLVDFI